MTTPTTGPRPTVFITTNRSQWVPSLVVRHSILRNAANPDAFDVKLVHVDEHRFLHGRDGQPYLRNGGRWTWIDDDTQTFMMLRFLSPALMDHRGRAVVVDPDMFLMCDIAELVNRDMGGKAILCHEKRADGGSFSSGIMLMDCAKLGHWDAARDFASFFTFERDHDLMMTLRYEDLATLGFLEPGWNAFDVLDGSTKILHNTTQRHQPWKTGLPLDFNILGPPSDEWWESGLPTRTLFPEGRCEPHPDPRQERLFFALLRECLDGGAVDEATVREAMQRNFLRHDALELVERARPEDADPPR